jgi:hypothetical protein
MGGVLLKYILLDGQLDRLNRYNVTRQPDLF